MEVHIAEEVVTLMPVNGETTGSDLTNTLQKLPGLVTDTVPSIARKNSRVFISS